VVISTPCFIYLLIFLMVLWFGLGLLFVCLAGALPLEPLHPPAQFLVLFIYLFIFIYFVALGFEVFAC
jgi:hypothetical protein